MLHLILNCDPRIYKYTFDGCGRQTECRSTMVHLTG